MVKTRYWKLLGNLEVANLNLNCKIQPGEIVAVKDEELFSKFEYDVNYEEVTKDGSPLKPEKPKTKKPAGDA